ncbi:MAG: hypothetical protein ACI93R_000044 [Flavobacteriales bacterium]|jgi:hypothetical protein
MASSLVPEKPLLVYPSLACTLGLEESIMLCTLADNTAAQEGRLGSGYRWYELSKEQLESLFPFWDSRDQQRILTNLREKGVLLLNGPPLASGDTLRFAFNEKQEQARSTQAPSRPFTQSPSQSSPQSQSAPPIKEPQPYQTHSSFLSKNSISPTWQADQNTLAQLAQHGITQSFATEHTPEFVTYWRERGEKHHSWGSKFMQHCLRKWREFQTKQHQKDQEQSMHSDWKPSIDAIEILTEQAAIRREFIEDAVPEFVLYWRERGEKHRTWNSKFVHHVRIQWLKFTSAIENNSVPQLITAHWQPSEDVYDVLRLANIDVVFAHSLIPEFVLYWRDRAILQSSWNTKYLQHVKYHWAQRHTLNNQGDAQQRLTRDIPLEEQLTDRSWAN